MVLLRISKFVFLLLALIGSQSFAAQDDDIPVANRLSPSTFQAKQSTPVEPDLADADAAATTGRAKAKRTVGIGTAFGFSNVPATKAADADGPDVLPVPIVNPRAAKKSSATNPDTAMADTDTGIGASGASANGVTPHKVSFGQDNSLFHNAVSTFHAGVIQMAAGASQLGQAIDPAHTTSENRDRQMMTNGLLNIQQGNEAMHRGRELYSEAIQYDQQQRNLHNLGYVPGNDSGIRSLNDLKFDENILGAKAQGVLGEMKEKSGLEPEELVESANEGKDGYDLLSKIRGLEMSPEELKAAAESIAEEKGRPKNPRLANGMTMKDLMAELNASAGKYENSGASLAGGGAVAQQVEAVNPNNMFEAMRSSANAGPAHVVFKQDTTKMDLGSASDRQIALNSNASNGVNEAKALLPHYTSAPARNLASSSESEKLAVESAAESNVPAAKVFQFADEGGEITAESGLFLRVAAAHRRFFRRTHEAQRAVPFARSAN